MEIKKIIALQICARPLRLKTIRIKNMLGKTTKVLDCLASLLRETKEGSVSRLRLISMASIKILDDSLQRKKRTPHISPRNGYFTRLTRFRLTDHPQVLVTLR